MASPNKNTKLPPGSVKVNSLDPALDSSHILYGWARKHYANWAGHLSLKSFSGGRAFYNVGAGSYAVDDSCFLIVNEKQNYTITIDSEEDIEPLIVFFESGFAEEVHRATTSKTIRLLDEPENASIDRFNFVPKLYSRNLINRTISELRSNVLTRRDDQLWLREKLHELMEGMLAGYRESKMEIERLPYLRASTREELYKRLHRAKDYIGAKYEREITLDEMAKVACLSPNHFLRTFKELFHETPHQCLTRLRLEKAKELLAKTELPVLAVCQSVGFESQSSFSLLFRRKFGVSPANFQSQKR